MGTRGKSKEKGERVGRIPSEECLWRCLAGQGPANLLGKLHWEGAMPLYSKTISPQPLPAAQLGLWCCIGKAFPLFPPCHLWLIS